MPVLTVFAGPNGSGKSSILKKLQFAGRGNLLEADAIAARIHASDPRLAAIAAGRVRERVAQGAHSVPDNDVRRYARSLSHVQHILKMVDEALLYDN